MRPRVGAAALAVFGGLLVVAAVFTPSWWGGPIHIAGRVIHNKTVHISMLRATGCNAGDGTCMGLDVGAAFRLTGIFALVLATATAAAAAAMALKWWRHSPMAGLYARLVLLGTALTVMGASFFLGMLPDRFAEIPVGFSPYGFFAGTAALALAAVLVLRRPVAMRAEAEPVDVRELLSTDMLRPAMLGPEPKMGRMGRYGHGPGAEEPSFTSPSAPRFRPLYEVQPMPPPPSGAYAMGPSGAYAPIAAPPPSGTYPSVSGTYPSVSGTYPSVSGAYPSASGAYPSASHAYPQVAPSPLPLATPLPRQTYPAATSPGLDPGASSTIERELSMSDAIETANLSPVTDVGEALPRAESEASWQVDPPVVAAARPPTEPPDPGFDLPTAPSQMSMAAMLAQQASEAEEQEDSSSFDLSDELSEGAGRGPRSATEVSAEMDSLDEALEEAAAEVAEAQEARELAGSATSTTVEVGRDSRTGTNDSGVFLRTESATNVSRAPVSRPPTATTSASLAALARLSKPALITMAPSATRKVPPTKAGEPAVAAAVAVAVAPGAAPPPAVAAAGAVTGAGEGTSPACPHCDAPMGWADKHLRYYCGTCRMYF